METIPGPYHVQIKSVKLFRLVYQVTLGADVISITQDRSEAYALCNLLNEAYQLGRNDPVHPRE